MKKDFLKFPIKAISFNRRYAQRFSSRRFGANDAEGWAAYKSDGSDDDDEEPVKTEEKLLMKRIQKKINDGLQDRASKEELEVIKKSIPSEFKDFPLEALRAMADEKEGVMVRLAAQGLELKRLESQLTKLPEDMSIRSQCSAWMKANESSIKTIKEGNSATLTAFDIKLNVRDAANPMLPVNVMPGGTDYISRYEVQSGINELLRPEPTFWDFIKKGTTGAETYIWVNKRPTEGEGAFIAPGVYKPAISFTVETEKSHAKKIAVSAKMALELLQDVEGFASWVESELRYQLMQKVNDTLQGSGAATSTLPEGLQHMSTPYDAATGVVTTQANFWDAVKAMVTMLRVKRFRGQIIAFVNPVDLANGVMTKAQNQGQLFIPPITGATIVEDLNMALGYVQVVAMDYYKLLIYKAFTL